MKIKIFYILFTAIFALALFENQTFAGIEYEYDNDIEIEGLDDNDLVELEALQISEMEKPKTEIVNRTVKVKDEKIAADTDELDMPVEEATITLVEEE